MFDGKYKKILNAMPDGVFVFDDKLRVQFTNVAFRRSFPDGVKQKGALSACLGCAEQGGCGNSPACGYCNFYRVMRAAVEERAEKKETLHTTVQRQGRTDTLSLAIRVLPVDEKGKLFLGITSGSYQSEMEREMLTAQEMQRRLLPAGKSVCGIPYAYVYIPRYEVGGDGTDVYELNGQAYGILSDVSGHGLSAGMLSTFVKIGMDKKQPDLALALRSLCGKFNELNQDERAYITVAAVRIDPNAQTLRYVIAGHNAPILLKTGVGIHEIEAPAPPISNWLDDFPYEEREMPFARGDILALFTDGVSECQNSAKEQFGIERVESVLMQSQSAADFIDKLSAAVRVFCGGDFTDDITAIAFDL